VSDDAENDAGGKTILRMGLLSINNSAIGGTLWVSASTDADIKRSDQLTITGKLGAGFGSFAATMYEAQVSSVVRPEPGDAARELRDWFAGAVQTAIPQPQASLGLGFLVGQKRALPADLAEALVIAGLTHIVVASGYNLTILVRLARRIFMKVSKYTAALAASLMIGGFVAVTGLSPSMSRAALVASLSLAAWYYGRRFHPLVLLSFAAAVTVMVNPAYMSGDLGWQLSFAAFAGVMILAPLLQRYFFGEKKPGFVRQILGETVAALIVTAPILIGAFGQFSNVAIIANLLVLPLVPLAMLLTFIAGIGALIVPNFATLIGLPATWLLGYMVYIAQWLSHLSWAQSAVQFSSWAVIGCYVLIVGVCVYMWRVTRYDLRDTNIVE
jgi:competence protein ComEC